MERRDILRDRAVSSQSPADWNLFKIMKNKCTASLKRDKKQHYINLYKKFENENDVSNLYKTTKHQLGWKSGVTPESFLIDGKRISSPAQLANIQLDFFNKKVKTLIDSVPTTNRDPLSVLKSALQRWGLRADLRPEFKLEEITMSKTAELLKQLGRSKSFWQ